MKLFNDDNEEKFAFELKEKLMEQLKLYDKSAYDDVSHSILALAKQVL